MSMGDGFIPGCLRAADVWVMRGHVYNVRHCEHSGGHRGKKGRSIFCGKSESTRIESKARLSLTTRAEL